MDDPAVEYDREVERLGGILTGYVRRLAVPARRIESLENNLRGAEIFLSTGCAMCHTPSWVTGTSHA